MVGAGRALLARLLAVVVDELKEKRN